MTPSGNSLLGLVKHLASVEYGWFCETFGRPTEPLPFDEEDENADLRVEPHETTAESDVCGDGASISAGRVCRPPTTPCAPTSPPSRTGDTDILRITVDLEEVADWYLGQQRRDVLKVRYRAAEHVER